MLLHIVLPADSIKFVVGMAHTKDKSMMMSPKGGMGIREPEIRNEETEKKLSML